MSPAPGRLTRMPAGRRYHAVQLQNPVTQTPNGDGDYVLQWGDLGGQAYASIQPASTRDVERIASTVAGVATHVVTLPWQEGVVPGTTRVVKGTRTFSVLGAQDPEERGIELVLLCAELLGAAP